MKKYSNLVMTKGSSNMWAKITSTHYLMVTKTSILCTTALRAFNNGTLVFTLPEGIMQLYPHMETINIAKSYRLQYKWRRFCSPMLASGTIRWKPCDGKYELEPPTEFHYLCVPSNIWLPTY